MDGNTEGEHNNLNSSTWLVVSFCQHILCMNEIDIRRGVVLQDFLRSIVNHPSIRKTGYFNIQNNLIVNGLCATDNYRIQLDISWSENNCFSHCELIIADNSDSNKKRMAVLTAKSLESELVEMDTSGMRENVIIDLNREGRRWEGGELNGKPFGFGREYSEDDNLVYEGFVYEGMKVCVGKEWNDDSNNNCLMYEGGYWNGERWGKGISYDLAGNVDYEGEWMNNHIITDHEDNDLMNDLIVLTSIENFVIGNRKYNDNQTTSLHFSPLLVQLTQIDIGYHCFQNIREFVIDGLESLESVKIGEKCFGIGDKERDDGVCRITNCPNLRQLEIGGGSFEDFKSFELSNVDSIQSIKFGRWCFRYAEVFSLKGE